MILTHKHLTSTTVIYVAVFAIAIAIPSSGSQLFAAQELARAVDGRQTDARSVNAPDQQERSVEELLKLLDSPKYAEREAATDQLSQRGDQTLRPMAMHFLISSPESSWRITRSLEEIATSGDQETFLKAVALLQLLVGTNSDQLEAQLLRLKFEWSTKQTVNAAKALESAGAKIENLETVNGPQALRNWMTKQTAQATGIKSVKSDLYNMSMDKRVKMIDEILSGSLQSNRKLVLGEKIKSQPRPQASQEEIEIFERQLPNQVIIRNGAIVQANSNRGVTASFDDSWKGNRAQFAELENLDSLSFVALEKQYVDRAKLETLNNISTLTTLEFKNCRFSGPALATVGLPKTIEDLRLRNQDVELSTIDRIFKLPINSLVFDDCKFSKAALNKVLSSAKLGSLEFAKTELDSGAFERLEKMKTLRSLKLSGCRFPFPAYKRFAKERPEVYVEFTTTAFLGVRSVPGESTCLISDVVSGSAAEVAGVQPDDLIVKVNGYEIGEFNDLRAHIALHKAGDQLELEILRNGAVIKLTVQLGDYADAPPR